MPLRRLTPDEHKTFTDKVSRLAIINTHALKKLYPGWTKQADDIVSCLVSVLVSISNTFCKTMQQDEKRTDAEYRHLYLRVLRGIVEMLMMEYDRVADSLEPCPHVVSDKPSDVN